MDGNIRFGLDAVKGVGYAAVEAIKRARAPKGGPFADLWDFCARVDSRAVNKKAIEALIKCGAFGSTGASRKGMLAVLEQAQAAGQKAQQDALIGQGSIFDLGRPGSAEQARAPCGDRSPAHAPIPADEFDRAELLAAEKESIGLFISAHPLKEVGAGAARRGPTARWPSLAGRRDGDWVTVGGMITQAKRIRTKKGDWMMFATLDDLEASVELVVFGKALAGRRRCAPAPTRSCSSAAGSTTRTATRRASIAQQIERFEPSRGGGQRSRGARPPSAVALPQPAARCASTRPRCRQPCWAS